MIKFGPTDVAKMGEEVTAVLKKNGVLFRRNYSIGGVQPDFIFKSPDGSLSVGETKAWAPTSVNLRRASSYAKLLAGAAGVRSAYVILPGMKRDLPKRGVVSATGLVSLFRSRGSTAKPLVGKKLRILTKSCDFPDKSTASMRPVIFAAMPFAKQYDDVWLVAICGAAKKLKAVACRVDKEEFTGDIIARIKSEIGRARAVVVDLSESKPNVIYEMAWAQALGKPVVLISSSPPETLPFDIRGLNVLFYEQGQTSALTQKLANRLEAVLNQ